MTLSGAETVQERPLLSRESKAWLLDCGIVHEVCIDHRGRLPGFCPLTVDVAVKDREWYRREVRENGRKEMYQEETPRNKFLITALVIICSYIISYLRKSCNNK